MAHIADAFKEEGNKLFRAGDFSGAQDKYTAAITRYPSNPLLFTNRAFARLKLQRWEGVVDDCLKSIELTGGHGFNYKAWFYLAQAQLALHHQNEALSSALKAYHQLLDPPAADVAKATTANLSTVSAFVIACKKAKFAAREQERALRRGSLLAELHSLLESSKRSALQNIETLLSTSQIGPIEASDAREEILLSSAAKTDELNSVFAVVDPVLHAPREVPDHLVDTITFEIMHDPVVTRTGHSYERATLLEHLKRSQTDPLTRERLVVADLRPNVALRHTLEEFWRTAGSWAVEW